MNIQFVLNILWLHILPYGKSTIKFYNQGDAKIVWFFLKDYVSQKYRLKLCRWENPGL